MRTRVGLFCDKIIEAGWLAAVIIVPLFFNIYSHRVFEPDKLSLLRSIAIVMSAAWLVRVADEARSGAGSDREGGSRPGTWARLRSTPLVLPTLLLVAVYLLSTFTSVAWKVSLLGSYQRLQGTYTTLSYIVVFFLMLDGLRTKRQLNRLITVMVLVSFPIAMYGLVQHFGLDPLPWGGNVTTRVASNMGNAIFVAAFLIMVVPLTLSRLLENWKETIGPVGKRDGLLGGLAFLLLVIALLVGMFVRRGEGVSWVRWVALLAGVGLQAPIYLLTPAERRPRVLAISLPLTFAFLVAFSWILELFFPPANSADAARYFWLGLLSAGVFILAMAAFAHYLRRPVSRLLLLAAYWVILIAQIICIFYTQSRGPLLGLLAGVFIYFVLLGLVRRQVWVPWLMSGGAVAMGLFLILFNIVDAPALEALREMPYVGRLGQVLQTESGTGKVRVLIWEGVVDMMEWHPPLEFPGDQGRFDVLNTLRPVIGYGPESMYVSYNRFYPPDLAHYERRNASPDRSHNETFDALAITGALGFLVYMFAFTSVFYYGLKWLGLIRERRQALAFLGLWLAGGVVGALGTWLWRGPEYIGVGIPGGVMLGLAAFVFLSVLQASWRRRSRLSEVGGRYSLWIVALLSAIVAHFVEIHFGIAIAATRTYFWVFGAMMVVIGTRLALQPAEETAVAAGGSPVAAGQEERGRSSQPPRGEHRASRRRRRGGAPQHEVRPRAAEGDDWLASILVLALIAILVLSTLLFDSLTIQQNNPGVLGTIWQSLTRSGGERSAVMLVQVLSVWLMVGLIGLGDLATRAESHGKEAPQWLVGIGLFALISFGGTLLFAFVHAGKLKPVVINAVDGRNPLVNTIDFYYLFVALIVVGLASLLAFLFRRRFRPWSVASVSGRAAGEGGLSAGGVAVIALAVVLAVVGGILIYATNTSIVRADILYKQGLSAERVQQWDEAIYFYDRAIDITPDQDFYYLFLGRAYMEKAKASPAEERESWLLESEKALQEARQIAPLNTDHSANLARLYRTWGGLSQGQERTDLLNRALDLYADATSLSPNNAQLHNEWGQTYLALGDVERALDKYQESLALDAEYAQTYLLLGEFYTQQEDWQQAADAFERAAEVSPRLVDAYSSLGYVSTKLGDAEGAVRAYEKAAELRPNNFTNRKNLAIVYEQVGRIDDAVIEATAALELAPENQKASIQSFLAQLRAQQAGTGLGEAEVQALQTLLATGRGYLDAEDWAAADEAYRQVLALDPNNIEAHSGLAYSYARQGRVEEAIAANLVVAGLMPGDYNSHKNLALLYQQKGDLASAITEAEKALAVAPESERQAVETFLDQLRQMSPAKGPEGEATPPAAAGERAGELPPQQRDGMYGTPPGMTIDPGKAYRATIATDKGDIVVDLAAAEAPQTVNNFVYLAGQGFYEGLTFHRVENQPGFSLIQGGDPLGRGNGGPGYTVPAEIGLPHDEGAIAMARLGDQANPERASSGSQFYICLVPIHQLDGGYTVFGYVVGGLDVARSIVVGDRILSVLVSEE